MPNLTSMQEPEDPFCNTTLEGNYEEVYQDEDPIDPNDIPSDVRKFLADPYNLEMMEKSIRENKIEIFLKDLMRELCLDRFKKVVLLYNQLQM